MPTTSLVCIYKNPFEQPPLLAGMWRKLPRNFGKAKPTNAQPRLYRRHVRDRNARLSICCPSLKPSCCRALGVTNFGCCPNRKQFSPGLGAICGFTWIAAAIHPLDHQAWILENILLVIFVAALALTYRRLQLSKAAYLLLAAFVLLHIIGAHYTYARIPVGLWARDYFGLSRNHYDRFAHGAFGFLLAYPIRELLLRFSGINRAWSFWLPPATILAVSGLFEIIESIVAEIVAPGQGVRWLGGQGDEWDAQNDMLSAMTGSLLMMGVVAFRERKNIDR